MVISSDPAVQLSERILSTYPAPIAVAWRHVLRSFTKKEEHDHMLDLVEIAAMMLATALASQYRLDAGEDPPVEDVLARMTAASFGTWVDAIGLLQEYCSTQKEYSIGRRIARELARKAPFEDQRKAIEAISRLVGQEHLDLPGKFNVVTFLQWAVTYRNELAHAMPKPSEEVCRVRLMWLAPAVGEFLGAISFMEDMPLVFVRRVIVREGGFACEVNDATGWDLDRFVHERPAQPETWAGSLYLCSPDGHPALRLLPIMFYGFCPQCTQEPRMFLLRKAAVLLDKGAVESCLSVDYTCSICGNRFQVKEEPVLGAFLDLLRRPPAPAREEVAAPVQVETIPSTPEPIPELLPTATPLAPELRPMVNPNVDAFLTLYSQSQQGNQRTRGLDEFGRRTYVETRLDTVLRPRILRGEVKLVILTGNAGDGKTAFIEQLEAEARRLGASSSVANGYGSTFILDGRRYQTIYDGSEDEEGKTNRGRLDEFFCDFKGDRPPAAQVTKVIAINEGHLRGFLLNNWDYKWLGGQVYRFLEREDAGLDPAVLIINLNLRSVVDSALDSGASIFDRVLGRFLAPEFWLECQICSAAMGCPIKFNIDSLNDPEYGAQVRRRLKSLYLVTHLRCRQHMTVRDLRSSLAYIIFNRYPCQHIHDELTNPEGARSDFGPRFYYNAAFGECALGEDAGTQDRLIRLFQEIDVAPVANPRLDNLLNFNPLSAIGLLGEFTMRSSGDSGWLDELYSKAANQDNVDPPPPSGYHAAMRRKYFFESVESVCAEAGYPTWEDLLPLRSLRRFLKILQDPDQLPSARDDLVVAIDRSERIYDEAVEAESLCVRKNVSRAALVKAFNQFPKDDFVCQVQGPGERATYAEYCPNVLRFVYTRDKQRSLEISLDLFELLERVRKGYVPGGKEIRGFFLNLLMFKKQLTALPTHAIILTEDEHRFYRLEKTGAKTLAIQEI